MSSGSTPGWHTQFTDKKKTTRFGVIFKFKRLVFTPVSFFAPRLISLGQLKSFAAGSAGFPDGWLTFFLVLEPAVTVMGKDGMRSLKNGDAGIAGSFAVVDLASAVAGVFEFSNTLGSFALVAHTGDVLSRDTILLRNNGVERVERFAHGNTAFVTVVYSGADVDVYVSGIGEPGDGRAFRRLFFCLFVSAWIAFKVFDDVVSISFALVELAPRLEVADGTPRRYRRPDFRMASSHQKSHMSAA